MTKAEQIAASLEAGSHSTAAPDDKRKNRLRAARDWINHYRQVDAMIEKMIQEDGVAFEDVANDDTLAGLITDVWEESADSKTEANTAKARMRYGSAPTAA